MSKKLMFCFVFFFSFLFYSEGHRKGSVPRLTLWFVNGCLLSVSPICPYVQIFSSCNGANLSGLVLTLMTACVRAYVWVLSSFSSFGLLATLWTVAHQAPLSMGIIQAKMLEWVAMPYSGGSSSCRDRTWVSCVAGRFFAAEPLGKLPNDIIVP